MFKQLHEEAYGLNFLSFEVLLIELIIYGWTDRLKLSQLTPPRISWCFGRRRRNS